MIVGKLKDIHRYKGINSNLDQAIDYISNNDLLAIPVGTQEIKGKDLRLLRESYQPRSIEECYFEAHQKFADIQIVLKGIEGMGYCDIATELEVIVEYDEVKDVKKLSGKGELLIPMTENMFVIVFPEDIHMPKVKIRDEQVEKAVIKVKL